MKKLFVGILIVMVMVVGMVGVVSADTKSNIHLIVDSLKKHYNIQAKDIWNRDSKKYCDDDGCCYLSIGNDRVSIETAGPWIIQVRIHSQQDGTPAYYQQACSAVFIALSNVKKQKAETIIEKHFIYASKKGIAKSKLYGVEITVKHSFSGKGLLECEFYKRN